MKKLQRTGMALVCLLALVTGLIIGGGRLYGEKPTTATAPATTQAAKNRGMLWKVTSPTTTVYLMGSMHLATPEVYPLSPDIEKAFKDSPILVVEFDESKVDQGQMMKMVMEQGMYQADDTLEKHVSAETLKAVNDYFIKLGMPTAGLTKMKPWFIGVTLSVLAIQKEGLDPSLGLDKHFLSHAKGKTIIELESADEQLKMMAGFDDKLQEKALTESIKEAANMKEMLAKMLQAWKTGDEKMTLELLMKDYDKDKDSQKYTDTLIFDRNAKMAEKIETLLKGDKPAFVVVGTLHLVGEKGIPSLLAKKKFKVEQPELTPAPPKAKPAATQK